jgi:hypothetical protein
MTKRVFTFHSLPCHACLDLDLLAYMLLTLDSKNSMEIALM